MLSVSRKFWMFDSPSTMCLQNVQEHVTSQVGIQGSETKHNSLATPPLAFGEKFEDVYEVILILDNREQFAMQG